MKRFFAPVMLGMFFVFTLCLKMDAFAQLYKLETKHSKIIYFGKSYDYLIPHVGASMESAYRFYQKYWNYYTDEKVSIFLNDFSDVGNAGTMTVPRDLLMISIAPFDYTFDVMPANERFQWLMNHELTHLVMGDKATAGDKFYRGLFGGKISTDNENPLSMIYSYLGSPRWYSPRWFHEGIAVFMETWMSGGLGRTLGGYDEMVFREMVKDSAYFYRPIGLETEGTTIDFQVGENSYLYGTRFVTYLASVYGAEKVKEFYKKSPDSYSFYAAQFKKIFGESVVDAWNQWIKAEKKFQGDNLKRVRKYPMTKKSTFTHRVLGSVSREYYNKKKHEIYCAVNRPGDLASLVAINTYSGKIRKIADVESPGLYYVTNFAYDESNNRIFCTTHNQNWRGLKIVNLDNGDEKTLFDYIRISELVYSNAEKALYGIQIIDGRTAIVKLGGDFSNVTRLYSIPFGYSLFDIDVSPDGNLLSGTFADAAGRQRLMVFNLDSLNLGKVDTTTVYEFEDNSASNFVFTNDGKDLIGTSYYTGVSNVYDVNIQNKSAKIMTNTDIGFFRPVEISDDSLIVFDYKTAGMTPVKIKKQYLSDVEPIEYLGMKALQKNPKLLDIKPEPLAELNNKNLIISEGRYDPFTETGLENVYPIVEGYKDFLAYGIQVNLSDELLLSSAKIKMTYSQNRLIPKNQRLHLALDYNYWQWQLRAGLNKSNFYDLFGPTKESRAGYYFQLGYTFNLLVENPIDSKLQLTGAYYGNLETLPQYQNINSGASRLSIFKADYHYSKLHKSIGGLEKESGYKFSADAEVANFASSVMPKATAKFENGWLTGMRNSSLWFRVSAGRVFSKQQNAFGQIYFGGFGNNYVDRLSVKRFRDMESFPGRKINQLAGKDFVKAGFEFDLPPLMIRQLGFLFAYVRFARLSLFQSNLVTDVSNNQLRLFHHNIGAQLDFQFVFFSLMKSTLSFGYARAFEKNMLPGNEFMISLKIL